MTGNATTGNLSTGIIVATGNINGGASTNITIGGSFTTTTGTVQSAILKSTTANVTGTANVGNLVTSGTITATGTISATGNINANASTINANNINVSSTVQGTSLAATYGLNVGGTANMAHVVLPSVTNIGVVAITNVGNVITVTTNGNHGMTVGGAQFTLAGTTSSTNPPNGTYVVATVPTTVTNISVSSITYVGNVVTVTTSVPHGMVARTSFTIAGVTSSTNAPNGTFVIATAPTTTTFTYVANSVPTGTLAGTITLTLPGTSTFTYTAATVPTGVINVSVAVLIIKPLMTSTGSGSFGGDLSAANLATGGGLSVTGNASVGNIGTLHVNATGNLYANSGILFANVANANTINASLLAAGNLYANAGLMQASNATFTSTLNAANFIANGSANFTGSLVRMDGNANIAGNIDSVTNISATGNVNANNMTIDNAFAAGNLSTANTVTAGTANIGHLTLPTVTLTGTGNITAIVYSGTTIRVTTVAPHGMSVIGAGITVTNTTASANAPNGSYTVSNIIDAFKFEYIATSAPTNTPSGIIGVGASTSIVIKPVLTSTGSGSFGGALSVTGNANAGNIGTTHIVASGNIDATSGTISASVANATTINTTNLSSTNLYANAGLIKALNSSITGTLSAANFTANGNATFTGTVVKMSNANITGSIESVTHITSTGNIVTSAGLIASLNSNVTGLATIGNANVTSNLNVAGTATHGNLSSLGILNVRGNANVGNVGMLHVTAAGNVNASGSMNVTGTANVGNLTFPAATTVAGAITATYAGPTITITCASGHRLAVGNEVVLSGITATTNAPNGVYLIASVPASPTVATSRVIAVESLTYSSTTITVTTTVPHLLSTGALVTVSGVTASTNPPNVTGLAVTVTNATQFTYTVASAPTGTIAGTIALSVAGTATTAFTVVAPVAPTGTLGGTIVVTIRPVITSSGSGLFDGRLKVGGNAEIFGSLTKVTDIFADGNLSANGTLSVASITANTLFTFTGATANLANVTLSNGNLSLAGNASVGNLNGTGVIKLTGTGESNFAGNLGAPHMFITGNVEGGILKSSGIMTAAGNVTGGNLVTNGLLSVAGNASVGNITTKDIDGTLIRVSGNVSGANLVASGILSVAGTANVGNLNLPSTLIPLLAGGSAISYSGTTISVATQNAHGLSNGTEITLTGVSGGTPPNVNQNGNPGWFVITVTGASTFTFTAVAPTSALNSASASLNARPFMVSTGSASYGGNIGASGRVTAASFSGDGSLLTNINVNAIGTVANSTYAASAGSATTATTSGTVTTANQPNITAVGSLISLVVAGNQNNGGNVAVTATSGTGTVATLTYANPGYIPFYVGQNVTVSGLVPAGYNGTVTVTSASATAITYNSAATGAMTSAAGAGRIVGTAISMTPAGNINAQYISANGSLLTSINGGNVSKVGSANTADTAGSAGTVTNAAQTAITSVGTLTSLSVSGSFSGAAINGTNITATGYIINSIGTGLSAAGTTQGTALGLAKTVNIISGATAGVNDGIRMPATVAGTTIIIINTTSVTIKVYPNTDGYIDGLAQNAAFTLGGGAKLTFVSGSTSQWYSLTAVYG